MDLNPTVHGSVLRHSLLKGISAQIVSAAVRLTHARTHTLTLDLVSTGSVVFSKIC